MWENAVLNDRLHLSHRLGNTLNHIFTSFIVMPLQSVKDLFPQLFTVHYTSSLSVGVKNIERSYVSPCNQTLRFLIPPQTNQYQIVQKTSLKQVIDAYV